MKKQICLLFCLALLGCQQQTEQKPEDLINQGKMVRILADIHMAEAQVESTLAYPDTALMVFSKLEKGIFEKHEVSEEQFRSTYDYYTSHVQEMDKLYEIVVDTLVSREAKYLLKEKPEMEVQPDSSTTDSDTARLNRIKRRLKNQNSATVEITGLN